jgi:hypothetical protein
MSNDYWDAEMIEMKTKLDSILNDNYIYLDNRILDYVLSPKAEGKPDGYDKWFKANEINERTNATYKRIQKNKSKLLSSKPKENAPTYVCENCGFTTQTYYPGGFNRFHGENCKLNKKENK